MARLTPWPEWIGTPGGVLLSSALVCSAAVTAATFTSRMSTGQRYRWDWAGSPIEQEAQVSARRYHDAWTGARRIVVRDSLLVLARPGVRVLLDRKIEAPGMARRLDERLNLAWGAFGISTPRVPVVLAWLDADRKAPFALGSFAALPAKAGEPCLVVLTGVDILWYQTTLVSGIARNARQMRDFMFGCALFARHGVPGAAVGAELRRIGWSPMALHYERSRYDLWGLGSTLDAAQYAAPWALPYLACAAGRAASCAEAADRSVSRVREKPPLMWSPTGRLGTDVAGRTLLSMLQLSLPAAAFDRLWRDDGDFGAALARVTGREKGDWFRQVLLRDIRPMLATFSPVFPLVWRAVLFLLLAAMTGILLQSRRTVTS